MCTTKNNTRVSSRKSYYINEYNILLDNEIGRDLCQEKV